MFKKLILGAVAAATVASPMLATAAEAQTYRTVTTVERQGARGDRVERRTVVRDQRQGNRYQRRVVVRQPAYRNWQRGQRFDRRYAANYRQVDYRQYRGRGLYSPPRGYQWAQSGNDAVLVALATGVIGAVIGGALR